MEISSYAINKLQLRKKCRTPSASYQNCRDGNSGINYLLTEHCTYPVTKIHLLRGECRKENPFITVAIA